MREEIKELLNDLKSMLGNFHLTSSNTTIGYCLNKLSLLEAEIEKDGEANNKKVCSMVELIKSILTKP